MLMKTEKCSLMMMHYITGDVEAGKMTVEECLKMAADCNIWNVDLLNERDEQKIRQYSLAMKATGVNVYCCVSTVSFFENEKNFQDILKSDMTTAQRLGAKLFMVVPFHVFMDRKKARNLGKAEIQKILVARYSQIVELAKEYDLLPCFEITAQDEFCLSGWMDCRYMLDQVPGLGLVFDTANMLAHGDDPISAYLALQDRICHVHMKDVQLVEKVSEQQAEYTPNNQAMVCCTWGRGVIPINQIYKMMEENQYSGLYGIEYAHCENKHYNLAENCSLLKDFFAGISR